MQQFERERGGRRRPIRNSLGGRGGWVFLVFTRRNVKNFILQTLGPYNFYASGKM